jgi:dTDP-4-dehydrorhamnose reductase
VKDTWLIVGADGLLGGELRRDCLRRGSAVAGTSFLPLAGSQGIVHLDLSKPASSWPKLPRCRAAVLCAAITNLEQCKRQPEMTRQVNVVQTALLAEQLAASGAFVVFISSNLVFDGTNPMRNPNEPTCPMTEYGRQKAEAEAAILRLGQRCAVVRLTKVFHRSLPVLSGWREKLRHGQVITPFSDYLFSPVPLERVIEALGRVAENEQGGVWQVSAREDVSYADLATQLATHDGSDSALVQPIPTPPGTLEHLPRFTTLDTARLEETFNLKLPTALEALRSAL